MSTLHVTCSDDTSRFLIFAGSPGGRDTVHNTVKRWPGWRRLRAAGRVPASCVGAVGIGSPCSVYSAPVSPVSAARLAGYTGRVAWQPEAHELCKRTLLKLELAEAALRDPPGKLRMTLPTERKPFDHQQQAMTAAIHLGPSLLIADDMGLGKTMSALWIAWQADPDQRVLIVCEAVTKHKWAREIAATLGEVWCEVISGTSKQRADKIASLQFRNRANEGASYAIINYDLLPAMPDHQLEVLVQWCNGGTLILDESYRVKNRKSKTFKKVALLAEDTHARLLLTGTPVRNRVDDLWSQVELIRPGTWTSYSDFCNRHLDMAKIQLGQGPKAKKVFSPVGAKNLRELNAVMNTLQIRRKKEDVLNLPPKLHSYPELELEGSHLKLYKAMREWAILQLDALADETNVFSPQAQGATEAALRCAQIAMGFVGGVPEPVMAKASDAIGKHAHKIKGRQHELVFPDSPKLQWLIETIECLWEQGSRLVVFSRFNGPLVWLRHRFERESFVLHGGQSAETKNEVVERFQSGERSLFLAQVRLTGYDLTTCQDEVFLSRDWSPAINAQAEDRCYRIGQRGTVNVQIPIVTNTIEGYMHKKLEAKAGDAEAALQHMTIGELKEAL